MQEPEVPSDQLAGLNLYQGDDELPDYVSSGDDASAVGSSVSQTQQTTIQVNASMVNDAVSMINSLREQVLVLMIYHINLNIDNSILFVYRLQLYRRQLLNMFPRTNLWILFLLLWHRLWFQSL